MTYTNPRIEALIEDWPFGRQRCRARFSVESNKRGERVKRWTENKARNGWNKPKATTYAPRVAIVDGDDGRIYILQTTVYDFINVMSGNMKVERETIHLGDPRYDEVLRLLNDRPDIVAEKVV